MYVASPTCMTEKKRPSSRMVWTPVNPVNPGHRTRGSSSASPARTFPRETRACACMHAPTHHTPHTTRLVQEQKKRKARKERREEEKKVCGDAGLRSPYLAHAKRALYQLSYVPFCRMCAHGGRVTAPRWCDTFFHTEGSSNFSLQSKFTLACESRRG